MFAVEPRPVEPHACGQLDGRQETRLPVPAVVSAEKLLIHNVDEEVLQRRQLGPLRQAGVVLSASREQSVDCQEDLASTARDREFTELTFHQAL